MLSLPPQNSFSSAVFSEYNLLKLFPCILKLQDISHLIKENDAEFKILSVQAKVINETVYYILQPIYNENINRSLTTCLNSVYFLLLWLITQMFHWEPLHHFYHLHHLQLLPHFQCFHHSQLGMQIFTVSSQGISNMVFPKTFNVNSWFYLIPYCLKPMTKQCCSRTSLSFLQRLQQDSLSRTIRATNAP